MLGQNSDQVLVIDFTKLEADANEAEAVTAKCKGKSQPDADQDPQRDVFLRFFCLKTSKKSPFVAGEDGLFF